MMHGYKIVPLMSLLVFSRKTRKTRREKRRTGSWKTLKKTGGWETKMLTIEQAEKYICDIPFDRWVTREELSVKWGVGDRKVRDIINFLRKASPKFIIISSSSHKGYKRPSTYEEIEACLKESESRMREEMAKQKQLRKLLKNRDQLGLGLVVL